MWTTGPLCKLLTFVGAWCLDGPVGDLMLSRCPVGRSCLRPLFLFFCLRHAHGVFVLLTLSEFGNPATISFRNGVQYNYNIAGSTVPSVTF